MNESIGKAFPKANRLLKRYQYKQVSSRAQRRQGSWLYVEVCDNLLSNTRLGITVTRKYGNACSRNRFKRTVREAFRLCYEQLPKGVDLIIRPRREMSDAKLPDLKEELLGLLTIHHI